MTALGFARWLKRQTFGLELREIAGLLQEREAMLHGIREAVLGYDKNGRVILANDAAQKLLQLPPDFEGRPLAEVLPPGGWATWQAARSAALICSCSPATGCWSLTGCPSGWRTGGIWAGWLRSTTRPSPRY